MLLVEGGGSHTSVFVSADGRILEHWEFSTLNRVGQSTFVESKVISQIASVATEHVVDVTYLALGAAATNRYLVSVMDAFRQTWRLHNLPWERLMFSNDIVPLLFAESNDANQVVVIAGTGSGIAARRRFDEVSRAGANEYLLGDEGGGFAIGQAGLKCALRSQATRSSSMLREFAEFWSKGDELNWYVYESRSPKVKIASFCEYVFQAEAQGDAKAGTIIDAAANDLAAQCEQAWHAVGRPGKVRFTCTGSLFTKSQSLFERFVSRIDENSWFHNVNARPIDFALLEHTAIQLVESPSVGGAISTAIPFKCL